MEFNTQYHRVTDTPKERILGPSMTEPEECLTIPEILSRYIRSGVKVDASFTGDDQDPGRDEFQKEWDSFEPPKEEPAPADPAPADPAPADPAPADPAPAPNSTK